jgi:sporulation protein YlmC with PRC-barrel domain
MSVAQSADPTVRETSSLIASDKVEGTPVYRSNGDKVGTIERVMLDKRRGNVAFAVMTFGGFLGIGDDYYPIPWQLLTYNEKLGGYEVNIAESQLKQAPKYGRTEPWAYTDQGREAQVFSYYGVNPYQ